MKTKSHLCRMLAAAILGLGVWSLKVYAANPDTMVVSVTPGNVTFGVTITSAMPSGYQFGSVNLAATTISTAAVVLTNSGNIAEYFAMRVSSTTPDNWGPVSGVPGTNQFRLMAYLNSTTQPLDATFVDALNGNIPGTSATLYGQGSTKTNAAAAKNLWLRLTMPNALTGAGGAQTMTIYVNGQSS